MLWQSLSLLLGSSFCLSLGACSTASETFDCPPGKGVGCKSISEVNQLIDQGEPEGAIGASGRDLRETPPPWDMPEDMRLDIRGDMQGGSLAERDVPSKSVQFILPLETSSPSSSFIAATAPQIEGPEDAPPSGEPVSDASGSDLSDSFGVRRLPEEAVRVWIAPFQDGQGNFHEGSVIHAVLKPGRWGLKPQGRGLGSVLHAREGE